MDKNRYLELEWPSKRIPPGGVFHNVKPSYSPDVQNIMKVLVEESKLTLSQRQHVDWCLRTGSSLVESKSKLHPSRKDRKTGVSRYPIISRRRSLTAIINSGDFERERYNPKQRIEDREVVKQQLQDIMEFGRIQHKMSRLQIIKKQKPPVKTLSTNEEIFNDLLTQIQERVEWLQDMEKLGEGNKHRDVIHHQIAERMKKIEKLKTESEVFTTFGKTDRSNTNNIDTKKVADKSSAPDESKCLCITKYKLNNKNLSSPPSHST